MGRRLSGKRVLVTGASSGIGRALAEKLARRGAAVVAAARSAEKLEELARGAAGAPGEVAAVPADVTLPEDRARLLDAARQRFGGLDVLINNAGVSGSGHFATATEELLRQTMEVNFFAPVELTRLAVPLLTEGSEPAIVNVSSMCGRRGLPAWPEYSASKFALSGFTEALRGEMARFGIDVILVVPGLTNSGMGDHLLRSEAKMKVDYGKGMSTDHVAEQTLRALEKGRREVVLGSEARWMLRANRFFPRLTDRLIARKVRKLYEQAQL
ncbi:MAG TPA: SDR family NAD(P)-dependent oxidoreductase [Gemmataceae bacterium]